MGPQPRELQKFDSLDQNAIDVVLWPFVKYGHFVLCVMRRNQSVTILDSMGTASGGRFIEEVQNRLDATHIFNGWYVCLGHSAQQQNAIDRGIFCVANAASILSGRSVPSKINALFRRLACRTAIGLQDTTHPKNLAQSKFFANLQGRGECKQVLAAVRQSADNEGTQVLQNVCKANQGHCHWKQWLALVDRLVERMERYEAELPQDEASTPRADSASRSGIWAAVEDIVTSEEHSGGGGQAAGTLFWRRADTDD